ncbi:hypothetical protein Tco_0193867, partial [Tanacetum coccineum]
LAHGQLQVIIPWRQLELLHGIRRRPQEVTYLQSLTIRLEEMRIKRRGSGQRMQHKLPPQNLLERVRRSVLMVGNWRG